MSALTRPFEGVLPFVATAEERSFKRAASKLGVSTAAVSKAVAALEAELGVRLLERTSRSTVLTHEGTLFLERARAAIASIESARESVVEARRVAQGEVRLSASPVLVPRIVAALPALSSRHPGLVLRLSVSDRIARLVEDDIDVAVRLGVLEGAELRSRKLRSTRWVTVAAPSYLARHGRPRDVGELASHRLLVFVGPNGKPRWPSTAGAGVELARAALSSDHGRTLVEAALAGLGITRVLDLMVDEALRDGALHPVLEADAMPGPDVHAVYLRGRGGTARVRAVLEALAAAFRG